MKINTLRYTIDDFNKDYPNDDACLDKVFKLVHSGLKCCPKCKNKVTFTRVATRRCYHCPECYHQIYPTKGTIFEKSTTPLTVWFYAMFLFAKSKNGLSACELQRQIGGNYKTCWRILMKIRELVSTPNNMLSGVIECDETFIGGKNKNRHKDKKVEHSQGRSFKDKTPVFGMIQRDGNVIAYVVDDTSANSLQPHIVTNVTKGSTVYTDEWNGYKGLSSKYNHDFVYHSRKQYVSGNCSTNKIENFWSVLKRTINGSYIHIHRPYMQQYVNEVAFRYNNKNKDVFNVMISCLSS